MIPFQKKLLSPRVTQGKPIERIQGDFGLLIQNFRVSFTRYNSYLLNLGTLHCHNSAQTYGPIFISVSPKDVGLLWYHQLLERIMGNYQLKLPYILNEQAFSQCLQESIMPIDMMSVTKLHKILFSCYYFHGSFIKDNHLGHIWLKTIATIVTEHTQLSDLSSLYSLSVLISLCTKVTSHTKLYVNSCVRSIGSDSL